VENISFPTKADWKKTKMAAQEEGLGGTLLKNKIMESYLIKKKLG